MTPPEVRGRIFYKDDMSGFNFIRNRLPISAVADQLLKYSAGQNPLSVAILSALIPACLPGFEDENVFTRTASREDNRVQLVSPTRSGRRVLPELAAIADDNDSRFFGALDADEQATLRKLLQKLADVHRINNLPVD